MVIESAAALIQVENAASDNNIVELHGSREAVNLAGQQGDRKELSKAQLRRAVS